MDNIILKTLNIAGFSEKEAKVYLALLELGRGDVTDIANKAELKRSIIYVILNQLIKKGYVSKITNKKTQHFTAVDPLKILHHLQNSTSEFKDILPIIKAVYNKSENKPSIHYFEGKEGVVSVFREINKYPQAHFLTSIKRLNNFIPEEVEKWKKGFKSGNLTCKSFYLLPQTGEDEKFAEFVKKNKQEAKFLPKGVQLNMDFSLYGNKVAITSIEENMFIVVIESENLYQSMRQIFEIL